MLGDDVSHVTRVCATPQVEPIRAAEGVVSTEPQLAARGLTLQVELDGQRVTLPRLPFRMGAGARACEERGPALGEHTELLTGKKSKL